MWTALLCGSRGQPQCTFTTASSVAAAAQDRRYLVLVAQDTAPTVRPPVEAMDAVVTENDDRRLKWALRLGLAVV